MADAPSDADLFAALHDTTAFSRSIVGGKKTAKLEARVSEELKEAARRRWHDLGYSSESEWIETLVAVNVFGVDHVRRMQEMRLAAVCGVSDNRTTGGQP